MIYIALRGAEVMQESFIRSKQQSGRWGVLDPAHPMPILHLNAEPPQLGLPLAPKIAVYHFLYFSCHVYF